MQDRFEFRGIHPVLGEIKEVKYIDFINNTVDFGDGDIFKIDEVNLTQSTGLKDKNGKLTYFDDFIKWEDGIFLIKQITDVKDRDYCRIVGVPIRYIKEYQEKQYGLTYSHLIILEGKIIGNIYENPELLEEK